ncbi:hypothetical protein [Paenirhodobacter sp.]|jgi:hypothetical protein|uniref:hypothetical protein n=1 Tax=Paenirhodobacter sp. TaxID=1965326 RepID=UPI003B506CB4
MEPVPLPYFLMLVLAIMVAAAVTLWVATHAGLSLSVLAPVALLGAVLARLFMKVER